MSLGQQLTKEGVAYAVVAILIVLFIIILNNITGLFDKIIPSDSTSKIAVNTFVSESSTGLSEPKNWVAILIIALIGFGIIRYISSKKETE